MSNLLYRSSILAISADMWRGLCIMMALYTACQRDTRGVLIKLLKMKKASKILPDSTRTSTWKKVNHNLFSLNYLVPA